MSGPRRSGENLSGIEVLQRGETLVFRPVGNSMRPRIENRALVTVEPLAPDAPIAEGDAVLCKVRGRVMLHLVKALRPDGQVLIGNNHGHINGWTSRAQVYGRMGSSRRSTSRCVEGVILEIASLAHDFAAVSTAGCKQVRGSGRSFPQCPPPQ
jgi:hypothetical protein